jgi:hypothetical protein
LVWFAHPPGTGAAKQPSQDGCVSHGLQHLSHTLQPVIGVLHEIVLLCWPQLCGTTHLQAAMHSPDDCDPVGSCAHCPVAALQLNFGVGTGVGTGVG